MKRTVNRELRRLLGGIAAASLAVLAGYLAMSWWLAALEQRIARFHAPAVALSAQLAGTVAATAMPRGVSPTALDRLDDEATFIAEVSRDVVQSAALLQALVALHEGEGDPAFAGMQRRLQRARDDAQGLIARLGDDPAQLARQAALQPQYASVVAEQSWRLHQQAVRELQHRIDDARRLFGWGFGAFCIAVAAALAVQLRRGLRSIDEVLQAEQQSLDQVAAVLDAIPDRWFVLDAQGRFAEASRPAPGQADADGPALHGQPLQLVPAPARPQELPPLESLLQGAGQSLDYAVAPDADGPRSFEARFRAMPNGQWLYISRDTSAQRRAQVAMARSRDELEQLVRERTQQLALARDAAEHANRAKSEFLSRMSHELRTPMNAVLGFAQLLGFDRGLGAKQREALDHILRAGKHLLHLINDVLDLANVESGRMALSPEPLGLHELLTEVVALMKPLAEQRRLSIEAEPADGAVVRGDRLRLKQVLLNLCSNAIKYNRVGGWVRLSCALQDEGRRLRIVVADSGQGIAAADLHRVFEPFDRLGAERSGIEGTGIGLSISKRLVELMDGRIGVDSVVGEGTRFWLDLPADRLGAAPAPLQIADGPGGSPRTGVDEATVLYVEDNPDNLRLVATILERHPRLRLLAAPSGALGLDLARAHRPDLILVDLHLPDVNGYALVQRLRREPALAETPIMAVTANAMPGEEARALAAGCDVYMTKPIDVVKFDAQLRRLLRRD